MATANTRGVIDYLTKSDLPEVARAVYDYSKKYIDDRVGQVATDLPVHVMKSLDDVVAGRVGKAVAALREGLEAENKELRAQVKAMGEANAAAVADLKSWLQSMPTPVVNVAAPDVRVPDVTVNVPKLDQPVIEVRSPDVVVNVPKLDQPSITVEASPLNLSPQFTMPELKMQPVNISMPEQAAPTVTVTVPRRKVKKLISYDQQGRPEAIEETEE